LVEKWIRALTVIIVSITELGFVHHRTLEVARFGKASIAEMLVFTDAIVPSLKASDVCRRGLGRRWTAQEEEDDHEHYLS
jgi:hypothetical protein